MPNIGDVKTGKDLGFKAIHNKMAWIPCTNCGKERWVFLKHGEPQYLVCFKCAHSILDQSTIKNPNWKGGRIITSEGYVALKLSPDDPFISMATKARYILEHRLVVARALGRCLLKTEFVHHINGMKDDNRYPENLEIISRRNHTLRTQFCNSCPLKVNGVAV